MLSHTIPSVIVLIDGHRGSLRVIIHRSGKLFPKCWYGYLNVCTVQNIIYTVYLSSFLHVCVTAKFVEYATEPLVHIDGYAHNTTLDSGDTVQLGTTAILVCRVTGIPYGVQNSYRWTCPHGTCNSGSHILKIPLISTSNGGDYTCTVLADGINKSAVFTFTVEQPSELS